MSKGRPKIDPIIRFWQNIRILPNGCWIWLLGKDKDGYGKFKVHGKTVRSHRFSYEYYRGTLNPNLQLDHIKCQNRACSNPWHLEEVTLQVNIARGNTGIKNKSKTHCANGHEYSQANTYIDNSGGRHCKECSRIRSGYKGNINNKDKIHCPKGHPYIYENYFHGIRQRRCKECISEYNKKYYQKKKS